MNFAGTMRAGISDFARDALMGCNRHCSRSLPGQVFRRRGCDASRRGPGCTVIKRNQPWRSGNTDSTNDGEDGDERDDGLPGAPGFRGAIHIENPRDAERSLANFSERGLSQHHAALNESLLGEVRQAFRVCARTGGFGKHRLIASHLALQRYAPLKPPDGGMKEEERLDDFLGEIGPVVPTAEVRELMQQNLV